MARKGATFLNLISAFNSQGLKDADKGFSTLGGKVSKFAKIAAAAMAAAAAAAVAYAGKLLVDGVKSAIEDEKAQAKLAATLENVTGATRKQISAVEDHIAKLSLAVGVADDQLRPAFENLVRATGDVSEAQKQLNLALDISAGTGRSLESVTLALAKAQTGNVSALTRLGIPLDAAAVKSKDLNAIFGQLTETFGGQAAVAADTFEGKMARLQVAFDEAKETVGSYVLDAITPLVTSLVDNIIPAVTEFAEKLGKDLKPVFEALAPIVKNVISYFQNMATQGSSANGFFQKLGEYVRWVWEYFQDFIPILQDFWSQIQSNIVPALKELGDIFVNNVLPSIKSFAEFIKPVILFLVNIFKNALVGAIEGAIQFIKGFLKVLSGLLDFITGVFTGDFSKAWEGLKNIVGGVLDAIIGAIKFAWNFGILKAFSLGWQAIKALVTKAWEGLKVAFQSGLKTIVEFFKKLPSRIMELAREWRSKLIEIGLNILKGIIEGLKKAPGMLVEVIKNVGSAIVNGFKSFFGISSPSKLMEQYGLWVTEGFVNGVNKGFDSKNLTEGLKKFLEQAKGELAKAKEVFNTFKNEVYGIIVDSLDFGKAIEESQQAKDAAAEGGESVGTTFLEALQKQADKAIAFAEKVAQLIKLGLSKDALSEVLAAGVDSGTLIADELIKGGSTAINKTNELVDSTKAAAKKVSKFAAESYFGTGVETARRMVKGFKEIIKEGGEGYKELMKEMDKLAKKLERTVKLKLQVSTTGVNLNTGSPITPSTAPSKSTAGTTINITVNGAIDPEGTARQIQNILTRSQLRAGAY